LIDGNWNSLESDAVATDVITVGNLGQFTVEDVSNESSKTVTLSVSGSNRFNMLYSAEGMEVYLPWMNTTAVTAADNSTVCSDITDNLATGQLGWNKVLTLDNATELTCTSTPATYTLVFDEENKEDSIGGGDQIMIVVGLDSDSEVTVSSVSTTYNNLAAEIGESKVYKEFLYSDLATEILDDQSGDHEKVILYYHGSEVSANVYLSEADATITSGGASALGDVLVTDAEINSVKSKNLIIVGGSCINSAAATVLGGAYCGEAFTSKTQVGAGQYMIKGFDGAFTSGKLALLVAGYMAADTTNAATYLKTQDVDTSASYKGTSATEATVVTTTA
jgi:hypothetical protein